MLDSASISFNVFVPDGTSGDWAVETFTVSDSEATSANINQLPFYHIKAGTYKRLRQNKTVVMSNVPFEKKTNLQFFQKAKGNVLINGLGLGMVLSAILTKKEVTSVTVVEISKDVIDLVAPSFLHDKRVKIIHADSLTFVPPKGIIYDAVWHDIWPDVCKDNLEDMKRLHRKYGRRAKWQASWSRELL